MFEDFKELLPAFPFMTALLFISWPLRAPPLRDITSPTLRHTKLLPRERKWGLCASDQWNIRSAEVSIGGGCGGAGALPYGTSRCAGRTVYEQMYFQVLARNDKV